MLLLLLLASCSKGPEADLALIGQARSLTAEWALVNEQATAGHLTATYVATMRKELRQQLQSAAKSLTKADSAYGREIQAVLAEPDDAPPAELRAHAGKFKQFEDSLESA
jgi:hypothetical protein